MAWSDALRWRAIHVGNRSSTKQPGVVGFVVAEQRLRADAFDRRCGIKPVAGEAGMINNDAVQAQSWGLATGIPPGIAEPQGRPHW
jgi:hypothetical protein